MYPLEEADKARIIVAIDEKMVLMGCSPRLLSIHIHGASAGKSLFRKIPVGVEPTLSSNYVLQYTPLPSTASGDESLRESHGAFV